MGMEHDLPMQRVSELFNVNSFIVSQVNPHVLPFVDQVQSSPSPRLSVDWLWRSVKWFVYSELRHRLLQLAHFVPPTRSVTKFLTQEYLGDINILPNVATTDFEQLLKNPSHERLMHCVREGELATWRKVAQIKDSFVIEQTLDECVFRAAAELNRTPKDASGLSDHRIDPRPLITMSHSSSDQLLW